MILSYLASVSRAAEQAFDCLLTCIHNLPPSTCTGHISLLKVIFY